MFDVAIKAPSAFAQEEPVIYRIPAHSSGQALLLVLGYLYTHNVDLTGTLQTIATPGKRVGGYDDPMLDGIMRIKSLHGPELGEG